MLTLEAALGTFRSAAGIHCLVQDRETQCWIKPGLPIIDRGTKLKKQIAKIRVKPNVGDTPVYAYLWFGYLAGLWFDPYTPNYLRGRCRPYNMCNNIFCCNPYHWEAEDPRKYHARGSVKDSLSFDDRENIRYEYETGIAASKLAPKYDVSPSTIYAIVHYNGSYERDYEESYHKTAKSSRTKDTFNWGDRQEIREKAKGYKGYVDLAKEYGVASSTISNICNYRGSYARDALV